MHVLAFHLPPVFNIVVGGWLIVLAVIIALAFAPDRGGDQ